MKKLLHFIFVAMMVAACSQDVIVEVQNPTADLTRTINVSFEGEDTRIQLNDELKTVWTKDDLVSVFYRSTVNEQWQFQGETGDRSGDIMPVDSSINPPATTNHIVVVYPYNEGYFYNSETRNVQASLPAEQTYLKDSYGLNGNIMISSSEYNQISLKSVCGWLKLQLTGSGEKVQSITLRGNDDEQVAGELYINSSDASSTLASTSNDEVAGGEAGGTLVRPGTILKDVTLNCGDGVELGTEPTAFYIALPPQTFATGLTIDIECDGYTPYSISTDKAIIIERNTIQPMAAVEFEGEQEQPNNEIWYTAKEQVAPYYSDVFGATIVSNEWDAETGKGIITFDGDITIIGEKAFYGGSILENSTNRDKLLSIYLPNSVTSIGQNAFSGCCQLTAVKLPNSLTEIKDYAFSACEKLISINLPNNVSIIGEGAFNSCKSIVDITIPNGITTINKSAFSNCSNLIHVNIPNSVSKIEVYAFYGCSLISDIVIPNSVTEIGESAFGNSGIKDLVVPESVITIGKSALCASNTLILNCNIPDGTTSIDYDNNNKTIYHNIIYGSPKEIIIGDNVTYIGKYAFASKTIQRLTIGKSVSTIASYAFNDCTLSILNIKDLASWCKCNIGYTITRAITQIDGVLLKDLIIPDGVTSIEKYLFSGCTSLTSVNISDSVTTIGKEAFSDCTNLTNIVIGNGVKTIDHSAFCGCDNITSVTIPKNVTTIGTSAFSTCGRLKTIYCKSNTPPSIQSSTFKNNASGRKIYVPASEDDSIINAYKAATGWKEYKAYIYEYDYTNE